MFTKNNVRVYHSKLEVTYCKCDLVSILASSMEMSLSLGPNVQRRESFATSQVAAVTDLPSNSAGRVQLSYWVFLRFRILNVAKTPGDVEYNFLVSFQLT